jgi:hypothetical protein
MHMLHGMTKKIATARIVKEGVGAVNQALKRHLELQIKTLQNAPRAVDKLERILKSKEQQEGGSYAY